MKRFAALGLVALAAVMASHGATRAQTTSTATTTATPTTTPTLSVTPTPTATAPPVQLLSPGAFALSAWYFPPPAQIVTSQVETNEMAAAQDQVLHLGTQSFAAEGRVTGYFADSGVRNMDAHGVDHPVFTRYLVSAFPSVAQSAAAFAQQRDGWDTALNDPTSSINGQLLPVNVQVGDQMSKGIYQAQVQSSQGSGVVSELLFQRGPYFVEIWQAVLQKDAAVYSPVDRPFMLSLAKALDTIASGQKLPALPRPTVNLRMESVRFEANGTKEALNKAPLTRAKIGSKVQMGAYFVLTSAPAGSRVNGDYWLTQGKRSLHKTYRHTLGSYPPNYYHQYVYNVPVPRAGTYHLKVAISIGTVSTSGTASLTVSKTGRLTVTSGPSRSVTAYQGAINRSVRTLRREALHLRVDL